MATITFDGPNKRITIGYDGAITSLTAVEIYSRWKEWVLAGNAQYLSAFSNSVGGDPLGGGVSLGQYVFLQNDLGWKITAEEYDYDVRITGDLYPIDTNDSMFEAVPGNTVVFTVQRSVGSVVVDGGGGGGSVDVNAVAAAVWNRNMSGHSVLGTFGDRIRKMITQR